MCSKNKHSLELSQVHVRSRTVLWLGSAAPFSSNTEHSIPSPEATSTPNFCSCSGRSDGHHGDSSEVEGQCGRTADWWWEMTAQEATGSSLKFIKMSHMDSIMIPARATNITLRDLINKHQLMEMLWALPSGLHEINALLLNIRRHTKQFTTLHH